MKLSPEDARRAIAGDFPEQQTPASVVERLRENLADSNPSRLVCVESGDLQSVLDAVERLSAEREGLREALETIARRVVPDHYDDKALIGWISAGEIRAARAALTQGESRQTGAGEDLRVPGGYRGPSSSGPVTPPSGGSSIVHPGDETNPDKWDMGRLR
jgi:hypothetical protein